MKTQGTGASGKAATVKTSGLAYKVGIGVILVGVVFIASSWLLGGVAFAAITALLTVLGAPEDRALLPPYEPEAGEQILRLFGVILLVCGACIVSIRLVVELLGLAGKPELTGKLGRADKVWLGAAAVGFLVVVTSGLSQVLHYEVFFYEYGPAGTMFILQAVGYGGAVIVFCGLATLAIGGPNRRRALLGWTDRVGWGKLGCGWINKLGLGLIVLALAGATIGFEDPSTIVAAAGIGILLVGIVPHFLAGGQP